MGYHTVIFDKLGMPLDDSLTLEFFCIAPNFKLRVEDPSQNPPKLGDILTEVVCTKDYTITLASGLFWKFEEGGIYPYRPIHIAKHLEFVKPIGTLTNVPKNQTRHKDRMYKNENICSSVASVLYLTTQNMGIPYPKTHPHVDGAEIMLQADKLHIAKMAKGQDFEKIVKAFIKNGGTDFTKNLNMAVDLLTKVDIASKDVEATQRRRDDQGTQDNHGEQNTQ
jgi:hypothetical protein